MEMKMNMKKENSTQLHTKKVTIHEIEYFITLVRLIHIMTYYVILHIRNDCATISEFAEDFQSKKCHSYQYIHNSNIQMK